MPMNQYFQNRETVVADRSIYLSVCLTICGTFMGCIGHSIVGAILDAHPEILVANELHALKKYYCTLTRKEQTIFKDEVERKGKEYVGPSSIQNSLSALLRPQSPTDVAMLVDFNIILNTAVCSQIGRVQHHDYSKM